MLSLALILAPLSALGRPPAGGARLWPAIYFLCLGLGFLFVENACMQRYSLFIGYPLFATVAVIAGFLVFVGAGSLAASRFRGRGKSLGWIVVGIAALLAIQVLALPPPHEAVESRSGRIGIPLMQVAPLAFALGMPFPIGF